MIDEFLSALCEAMVPDRLRRPIKIALAVAIVVTVVIVLSR